MYLCINQSGFLIIIIDQYAVHKVYPYKPIYAQFAGQAIPNCSLTMMISVTLKAPLPPLPSLQVSVQYLWSWLSLLLLNENFTGLTITFIGLNSILYLHKFI